jgi:hypothetical protein
MIEVPPVFMTVGISRLEAAMPKLLFAIALMVAFAGLGTGMGHAQAISGYGQGRYCATVFNGEGSVREICHFNDFAACQAEVIAGNRGTCGPNPYYSGRTSAPEKRKGQRQPHQ